MLSSFSISSANTKQKQTKLNETNRIREVEEKGCKAKTKTNSIQQIVIFQIETVKRAP